MSYPAQTLVDTHLKKLIGSAVRSEADLEGCVESASIDVPLRGKVHLVNSSFSAFQGSVREEVEKHTVKTFDLQDPVDMYQNQAYMVKVLDVDLPSDLSAKFSPKSTTGRVDTFVRTLIDGGHQSDVVPKGGSGEVWLHIRPQRFNITVQEGVKLNQLRVFDETTESLCPLDLYEMLVGTYDSVSNHQPERNTFSFSLNVPTTGLVGYRAKDTRQFIDFRKPNSLDPKDFFDKIENLGTDYLTLEQGQFYILSTRELIRIPDKYSAEMVAFDEGYGEVRVHYAGFFDPGFGCTDKNPGASGVLEVRTHENTRIRHGQPTGLLEVRENKSLPAASYGFAEDKPNNYQGQRGSQLAKFFKPWA